MAAWKGLAALAILVAGAVTAFAVYTFGWHDNDGGAPANRWVRTVRSAGGTQRIYTLRDGDVVVRPQAATRCEASAEGGTRNLFCTRTRGGRHQVIFYSDAVLV